MKRIIFFVISATLFFSTLSHARTHVCDGLRIFGHVFVDNQANPKILLRISTGSEFSGTITYDDSIANIRGVCSGDRMSVTWSSSKFKGSIQGRVDFGWAPHSYEFNDLSGEINGKPLRFNKLATPIFGSGGH